MFQDPNNPDRNIADADFINRWILRHPLRAPLVALAIGVALFAVTYHFKAWRLMAGAFLITAAGVFLLIYGLARKMSEMTSVRMICRNCNSSTIMPSKAVSTGQPVKCPNCDNGWLEQLQ